jgi:uncharacterized protein (DUF488 family)
LPRNLPRPGQRAHEPPGQAASFEDIALPAALEVPVMTIGHSNRPWPEFVRMLEAAEITAVFDVRRFPVSSRYPYFNQGCMIAALRAVSIAYWHFPELGGYRDGKGIEAETANDGWPPGFLRRYADYARTPAFRAGLAALRAALRPGAAIMCAERGWRDCHRQIIADYLIAAGHHIVHVLDAERREKGALTPFASLDADGGIAYAARREQLGLGL